MNIIKASVLAMCICVVGCTTFTNQPVTTSIPNDIKDRNNYLPTAQWKYELPELAGSILVKYKTPVEGRYWDVTDRIIKANSEPKKEAIDKGVLITRLVDRRADAKLKAIGLGGASLSANQKMEFTFADTRRVFIPRADWDDVRLKAEAAKGLKDNEEAKYFIRGALLSVIQRRVYTKVEGMVKNISTSGLKAEGGMYNAAETYTKDFAIHLTLKPLQDFRDDQNKFVGEDTQVTGLWIDEDLRLSID